MASRNPSAEVMANIAHDLSAPLSVSLSHIQRVLNHSDTLNESEKQACLSSAMSCLQSLIQQVHRISELVRLDSGETRPECEPFSMQDLINEELLPKFESAAAEKGQTLTANCRSNLKSASGDCEMITVALSALIDNAVRYSQCGAAIVLTAEQLPDRIRIGVSDSGPGISPADLPHIFDRFYRADKSRGRDGGASGLGLAMARQILKLHGEEIFVSSSLGFGSCFWFYLPTNSK